MSGATAACPVCRSEAPRTGALLGRYELAACGRCTLRFAPDALGATPDYDDVYATDEYQRSCVDPLREAADPATFATWATYRPFFARVEPKAAPRLLDVGCGVGAFCQAAKLHGFEVAGIDVSATAVAEGQARGDVPLRVATLEEVVGAGERYDVVTAFEVLEHLSDPVAFLSEARKLLGPGGHLFATVPRWDSPTVHEATRPDWLPPIHVSFFTAAALAEAGRRAGFPSVEVGDVVADPLVPTPRRALGWLLRRARHGRRDRPGLFLHARA